MASYNLGNRARSRIYQYFLYISIWVLGPTQHPIQWFMVVGDLGAKLTTQLHLVLSLRPHDAVIHSIIHFCGLTKHSTNFTIYLEFTLQDICDGKFRKTVSTLKENWNSGELMGVNRHISFWEISICILFVTI